MTDQSRSLKDVILPSDLYELTVLLPGEFIDGYQELQKKIMSGVVPLDVFEEMWTGELVDLSWDIFRLRQLKANLLKMEIAKEICSASSIIDEEARKYAVKRDAQRSTREGCITEPADPEFDKLFNSVAATMDMRLVAASVLEKKLDLIDRIDDMTAVYQVRRNAILREISHHRTTFAPVLHGLIAALSETSLCPPSRSQQHGK